MKQIDWIEELEIALDDKKLIAKMIEDPLYFSKLRERLDRETIKKRVEKMLNIARNIKNELIRN